MSKNEAEKITSIKIISIDEFVHCNFIKNISVLKPLIFDY